MKEKQIYYPKLILFIVCDYYYYQRCHSDLISDKICFRGERKIFQQTTQKCSIIFTFLRKNLAKKEKLVNIIIERCHLLHLLLQQPISPPKSSTSSSLHGFPNPMSQVTTERCAPFSSCNSQSMSWEISILLKTSHLLNLLNL